MACTSGCPTQDHSSYGECLRSKGARVAGVNGQDRTAQKKWDSELDAYRAARMEGLQPATTQRKDIDHARRAADIVGAPVKLNPLPGV